MKVTSRGQRRAIASHSLLWLFFVREWVKTAFLLFPVCHDLSSACFLFLLSLHFYIVAIRLLLFFFNSLAVSADVATSVAAFVNSTDDGRVIDVFVGGRRRGDRRVPTLLLLFLLFFLFFLFLLFLQLAAVRTLLSAQHFIINSIHDNNINSININIIINIDIDSWFIHGRRSCSLCFRWDWRRWWNYHSHLR